jgi:hypothetical protein
MFDFSSIPAGASFPEAITALVGMAPTVSKDQLRSATNASIDHMLGLIKDADDAIVVLVPRDENAFDAHAAPEHQHDGWTLGHVIVHATASSEESAFIAAELARGVENHGRSRYETPWESITTIAQCRQRLEESRRMRLASLDIWPDAPMLDNAYTLTEGAPPVNAIARFLLGLRHESSHHGQIAEIVAQASKRA